MGGGERLGQASRREAGELAMGRRGRAVKGRADRAGADSLLAAFSGLTPNVTSSLTPPSQGPHEKWDGSRAQGHQPNDESGLRPAGPVSKGDLTFSHGKSRRRAQSCETSNPCTQLTNIPSAAWAGKLLSPRPWRGIVGTPLCAHCPSAHLGISWVLSDATCPRSPYSCEGA